MKGSIVKGRPYKYIVMYVYPVGKILQTGYQGFNKKDDCLVFIDVSCKQCLYACIFKNTNIFINCVKNFFDFFNRPL